MCARRNAAIASLVTLGSRLGSSGYWWRMCAVSACWARTSSIVFRKLKKVSRRVRWLVSGRSILRLKCLPLLVSFVVNLVTFLKWRSDFIFFEFDFFFDLEECLLFRWFDSELEIELESERGRKSLNWTMKKSRCRRGHRCCQREGYWEQRKQQENSSGKKRRPQRRCSRRDLRDSLGVRNLRLHTFGANDLDARSSGCRTLFARP